MKTKFLTTALLGLITLLSNAQNVQSNALATSGGLQAGTTITGGGNTFYGYYAGGNSTGNSNTFIGYTAGGDCTGNENVIIGWNAGTTHGNNNIFIGANSAPEGGENSSGNVFIGQSSGFSEFGDNKLIIANNEEKKLIWGDFLENKLKFNAKVGVGYGFGNYPSTAGGTSLANYNLFVKGGILAEEIRVNLQSSWADYVFDKNYKLPAIEEIEKYISEKGHLPNVPSAQKVKEEGIELGEMAKIQQEKIEELTLYIIEQNKINKKQNDEIEELKKMILEISQKK